MHDRKYRGIAPRGGFAPIGVLVLGVGAIHDKNKHEKTLQNRSIKPRCDNPRGYGNARLLRPLHLSGGQARRLRVHELQLVVATCLTLRFCYKLVIVLVFFCARRNPGVVTIEETASGCFAKNQWTED